MDKVIKVCKFIVQNRRTIGVIIGSTLSLLGYTEFGAFATKVGEV